MPRTSDETAAMERRAYWMLAAAFAAAYLFAGTILPWHAGPKAGAMRHLLFGIAQVRLDGAHVFITIPLVVIAVLLLAVRDRSGGHREPGISLRVRLAVSSLAAVAFLVLHNNSLNADALTFADKFARDVPLLGAHVTHDEMWELYLHSRLWAWTHAAFGWDVATNYRVASSFAGGVFVFLLLTYSGRITARAPLVAVLCCTAGAYMQLFFGDVENYTLTAVWLLGYFLASARFIERKAGVVMPSLLLAVGITFHLLCGFLLPSLAYLYGIGIRRGAWKSVVLGAAAGLAAIAGTLAFFHFHGLPIRNLRYHSHAMGRGDDFLSLLAEPTSRHFFGVIDLMLLLVPAWTLLPVLAIFRRIPRDEMNTHLLIASSGMVLLAFAWRSLIGVYGDWNLFAAAALPISFLVWRNGLAVPRMHECGSPLRLLGALFFVHSYSWILSNHFFVTP